MRFLRFFLFTLFLMVAERVRADDFVVHCREAGYGYLRIPGSTLCLAPRGFVRAEYLAGLRFPPFNKASDDHVGTITKTQIGVDFVATESEIVNGGRLRLAIARESGLPTVWTDGIGTQRTLVDIDEAWIRLGPFSMGRGPSRFDFYRDAFNYTPLPISDLTANFFAVRVPLTSWLYAEASVENGYERVNGLTQLQSALLNRPDLVGVLRASVTWPYPGEINFSAAIPKSRTDLFAWQAGAIFYLGGERPHLFILQGGMSRGPPSFLGMDRGMMQAITGADVSLYDSSALRGFSGALIYRRPIWSERWTATSFAGFGQIKPAYGFTTGAVGAASLMMAGGNLEWRSKQGLMVGAELVYVLAETPRTPYTRFGEGAIFRLRIEKGF